MPTSTIAATDFELTLRRRVRPAAATRHPQRQLATDEGDTVLVDFTVKSIRESATRNRFEGENTFQTASKKLAWLNGTKSRHEGEYNPVTGEQNLRVYATR